MKLNKYTYFFGGVFTSLIIFSFLNFYSVDESDLNGNFPQQYRILTPSIPEKMEFCGEPVPLDNFEVKERIEREFIVNTYWHSATLLLLKNAGRWFPVIEPILAKNGIPDDFKYMCMIESNLSNAVSPVGAAGFWQFMKPAAQKYGLEVNDEIDERYHVEKATEAACKYLKDSYAIYGSWTLAAGSYNMGTNGIDNQQERQKTKNYYNLLLNEETSRFVPRILSMKAIYSNPKNYGFDLNEKDLYAPFRTKLVRVSTKVEHFADFAAKHNINYKALKYFNPWLRENYLTNKQGKTYEVKIPEDGTFSTIEDSN